MQNETPARMTMLSTGGGLLLLFLLCSKVNKLTTVDFVARLFEPVAVMQLVAILFENKCCQAEESSCPAGCFCATKRGDHLPPDLVCQKKKKTCVCGDSIVYILASGRTKDSMCFDGERQTRP